MRERPSSHRIWVEHCQTTVYFLSAASKVPRDHSSRVWGNKRNVCAQQAFAQPCQLVGGPVVYLCLMTGASVHSNVEAISRSVVGLALFLGKSLSQARGRTLPKRRHKEEKVVHSSNTGWRTKTYIVVFEKKKKKCLYSKRLGNSDLKKT